MEQKDNEFTGYVDMFEIIKRVIVRLPLIISCSLIFYLFGLAVVTFSEKEFDANVKLHISLQKLNDKLYLLNKQLVSGDHASFTSFVGKRISLSVENRSLIEEKIRSELAFLLNPDIPMVERLELELDWLNDLVVEKPKGMSEEEYIHLMNLATTSLTFYGDPGKEVFLKFNSKNKEFTHAFIQEVIKQISFTIKSATRLEIKTLLKNFNIEKEEFITELLFEIKNAEKFFNENQKLGLELLKTVKPISDERYKIERGLDDWVESHSKSGSLFLRSLQLQSLFEKIKTDDFFEYTTLLLENSPMGENKTFNIFLYNLELTEFEYNWLESNLLFLFSVLGIIFGTIFALFTKKRNFIW